MQVLPKQSASSSAKRRASYKRRRLNDAGIAHLLLIGIAGILLFLVVASLTPFKDLKLTTLFPKQSSKAVSIDLFPIGLFEDGTITNTPASMQALITFSRNLNLDSVLFTNNKVGAPLQLQMLTTSDQQNFDVYFSPTNELSTQWYNSTISATLANAQSIITPLVNQLKIHPSVKAYNLLDDVTMVNADKLGLAIQVFDTLDPSKTASAVYLQDPHAKVVDVNKPSHVYTYYYPAKTSKAACDWNFTSDTNNDFSLNYRQVNRYKVKDTDPTYAILQMHSTTTGPASTQLRVPTPEEMSLQNWMALGEASKGIFWFIYSSEQGWVGVKDNPSIATQIGQLAGRTKALIPILKNLQKAENYFSLAGSGNRYISTLQNNIDGKYYIMVANGSCTASQDLTVSSTVFSGQLKNVESGQTISLNTPITVAAGDAKIFEVTNLSGSIPASSPAPNIFANSSFETLSSGYPTSWGGAKVGVATDSTTAHTGTNSLKMTGAAISYTSQSPALLKPGTLYTIKYWLKSSVPLTGKGVGFRIYSGVSGSVPADVIFTNGDNTAWKQVTETFYTPINYGTGGRLDLYWDLKAGEIAWVDDVFICEGKDCLPKVINVLSPSTAPTTTPTPTPSPSPSPSASTVGVPKVDADYSKDVQTWWDQHKLNPNSPGGIAIGAITQPQPIVNVKQQFNSNIQAAIDSLPASGGTLFFEPGTYIHNIQMIGRENVHFISDGPDAIISGGPTTSDSLTTQSVIAGCSIASTYTPYNQALYIASNPSHAAAIDCVNNRKGGFYFKNLTFDGAGTAQMAFFLRATRDLVFDNVTFQNFFDPQAYHAGLINANGYVDNVWCRGCHFKGSQRWAIMLDGVHGGGVINSTFEGYTGSGQVGILTNDDFTIDLNNNGTFDPNEIRITNYAVIEGNQFIAYAANNIGATGANILVKNNTQLGNSQYFANFSVKNSAARQISYNYTGNMVLNNTTKAVQYLGYFGGPEFCPNTIVTDPSRCATFGNFTVKNNRVQNATNFLNDAAIDSNDSPHYIGTSTQVSNNCVNNLIYGTTTPCPSNFPAGSTNPNPTPKPGDINGDNKVDIFDYNQLLTDYGKQQSGLASDLDKNGKVDIFDYNILLTNYGK